MDGLVNAPVWVWFLVVIPESVIFALVLTMLFDWWRGYPIGLLNRLCPHCGKESSEDDL